MAKKLDEQGFKDMLMDSMTNDLMENVTGYFKVNCYPEDVFDESDLEDWAERNGFVRKEKADQQQAS